MEGSVYQRKDGRWVGAVVIGRDSNGKMKRKCVYAKTKKEVNIALNKLIYELNNNIYRDPGNVTFGSYLDEWYDQNINSWENTTASLYKMYLEKHVKPNLGNIKLKDILPMHITEFKNKKLKESSPNTVLKYLALLHKSFDYACKNSLILTNPVDNVERPKKLRYKPTIYSNDQFMQLLKHVQGTFDEIPILLAGACGFRRGEIFGLRWCDVDFKNKTLTVIETNVRFDKELTKKPKNQTSARTIKAPNFVFDALIRYKNSQKIIDLQSQNVCDKYKAQPYSKHFSLILEKFDMPKIRLHDLRHFNAVIMMMYGVPDKVAASRLGHSNTQTLREVYQHVLVDMEEEAANKINDLFNT